VHTAPDLKTLSGWTEITHPFHPRRHQQFKVLKVRRVSGMPILSLQDPRGGIFSIAQDWTDLADPSMQTAADLVPTVIYFASLLILADIVNEIEQIRQEERKGVLRDDRVA
jgi:hypothetical protein